MNLRVLLVGVVLLGCARPQKKASSSAQPSSPQPSPPLPSPPSQVPAALADGASPPTSGRVVDIAAGGHSTCALLEDGRVACWGANWAGQLGDGMLEARARPGLVSGIDDAVEIAMDQETTFYLACARSRSGDVSCWGDRSGRNLAPREMRGMFGVHSIVVAGGEVCGIVGERMAVLAPHNVERIVDAKDQEKGWVLCTEPDRFWPWAIFVRGATRIAMGYSHGCAILKDRTVACWGKNSRGQLGFDAPSASHIRNRPGAVPGLSDVVDIAAAQAHTCALTAAGVISCWGEAGPPPEGRRSFAGTLVVREGVRDAVQLATGEDLACALLKDRSVTCWGARRGGQPGATKSVSPPVKIADVTGALALSLGSGHACAVLESGGVRCWGANSLGQLGNGMSERVGPASDVLDLPWKAAPPRLPVDLATVASIRAALSRAPADLQTVVEMADEATGIVVHVAGKREADLHCDLRKHLETHSLAAIQSFSCASDLHRCVAVRPPGLGGGGYAFLFGHQGGRLLLRAVIRYPGPEVPPATDSEKVMRAVERTTGTCAVWRALEAADGSLIGDELWVYREPDTGHGEEGGPWIDHFCGEEARQAALAFVQMAGPGWRCRGSFCETSFGHLQHQVTTRPDRHGVRRLFTIASLDEPDLEAPEALEAKSAYARFLRRATPSCPRSSKGAP